MKIESAYYKKLDKKIVQCLICPHNCKIKPGKKGICKNRINEDGVLYAINYGEVASVATDPIEKKPLYHFYPSSYIFSVGNNGCNFQCPFCQNWQLSQLELPTRYISPEELAYMASRGNSIGIAYTYAEPMIWFEYIRDTAREIHKRGLKNVLVTNGFINKEPFKDLIPFIDAMNIDLKSMDANFYKKLCKGKLEPVLEIIKLAYESNIHIEITNLIITGENDSIELIDELIDFVSSISKTIPLHFSRYFPHYRMRNPQTPVETLIKARERALKKLYYVYIGNVPDEKYNSTFCYNCGKMVIRRWAYFINLIGVEDSKCKYCSAPLHFVGL